MLRLLLAAALMTAALTLALPVGIGAGVRLPGADPLPVPVLAQWGPAAEAPLPEPGGADSLDVRVYFPDRDEIAVMPLGEYLKGVVAAEMPPDFEMEALKAQFVVARTYTVRRMPQFGGKGGCPLRPEADVCADYRTGQAYMSREELEAKYGPLVAASYWRRLSQAQAETEGEVLTYQGELIDALYHAVSG
ncbi:MAG: SpoIID/LytB domain-containing protein, partial [Symbiobacteriaceae bacterium]